MLSEAGWRSVVAAPSRPSQSGVASDIHVSCRFAKYFPAQKTYAVRRDQKRCFFDHCKMACDLSFCETSTCHSVAHSSSLPPPILAAGRCRRRFFGGHSAGQTPRADDAVWVSDGGSLSLSSAVSHGKGWRERGGKGWETAFGSLFICFAKCRRGLTLSVIVGRRVSDRRASICTNVLQARHTQRWSRSRASCPSVTRQLCMRFLRTSLQGPLLHDSTGPII